MPLLFFSNFEKSKNDVSIKNFLGQPELFIAIFVQLDS
jgi:hypothetical protein